MNIFVGNLPLSIDEAQLRQTFEAFGIIASVKFSTDKLTGKSKGIATVDMPNDRDALKAIKELNGTMLMGRSIIVK